VIAVTISPVALTALFILVYVAGMVVGAGVVVMLIEAQRAKRRERSGLRVRRTHLHEVAHG
jgi:hypothetical protein